MDRKISDVDRDVPDDVGPFSDHPQPSVRGARFEHVGLEGGAIDSREDLPMHWINGVDDRRARRKVKVARLIDLKRQSTHMSPLLVDGLLILTAGRFGCEVGVALCVDRAAKTADPGDLCDSVVLALGDGSAAMARLTAEPAAGVAVEVGGRSQAARAGAGTGGR